MMTSFTHLGPLDLTEASLVPVYIVHGGKHVAYPSVPAIMLTEAVCIASIERDERSRQECGNLVRVGGYGFR